MALPSTNQACSNFTLRILYKQILTELNPDQQHKLLALLWRFALNYCYSVPWGYHSSTSELPPLFPDYSTCSQQANLGELRAMLSWGARYLPSNIAKVKRDLAESPLARLPMGVIEQEILLSRDLFFDHANPVLFPPPP